MINFNKDVTRSLYCPRWSAARAKAFDASISPALEKIAPGGDKTKSAELSNAFRDFAKGVRAP